VIPVTKPFLPSKSDFDNLVSEIWERNWLTNNGPLVQRLEKEIIEKLGLDYMLFLANGTVALQIAIKALNLQGEIITTPFSYVATTSSIVWENCTPVYVDIDIDTWNINPNLIESAITDKTTAILATHVFGNPCNVSQIELIAKKHNLNVIYDAAHAFGVKVHNKSALTFGDIATTSFHATKLFHTIEGGGVVTNQRTLNEKMKLLRNFGHTSPITMNGVGINGKNSEFHAAMGICNLKHFDDIILKRKSIYFQYDEAIIGLPVQKQRLHENIIYNYSYYPLLFESNATMVKVINAMNEKDIFPRRYFFPSLCSLNYVDSEVMDVSTSIASRILCMPLYHSLTDSDISKVTTVLKETLA